MFATIVVNYRAEPRPDRPRLSIFIDDPLQTSIGDLLTPFFEGQVLEQPQDCLEPVRDLLNTFPEDILDGWCIMVSTLEGTHTLKRQDSIPTFTPHIQRQVEDD